MARIISGMIIIITMYIWACIADEKRRKNKR
jgi:hypothetical protein